MRDVERRIAVCRAEVRRADGAPTKIVGQGAVYNVETVIGSNFRERIMPGAFRDAIASADVRSLFNHDNNFVLGRTTAGTLTLSDGPDGLAYEATPPATRSDVLESVERGDVTGSSFSFRVAKDGDEWTRSTRAGELPLRTIHRFAELYDVGPVTFPAYNEATAEARDMASALMTPVPVVVVPAALETRASMTPQEGEEAAELIQYQTAGSALTQAATVLASAQAIVAALIANETDSPTETPEAEAAEEELETAQLRSLLVLCGQICGAVSGVSALTQAMLSDEWDPILYARSAVVADEDRNRRLRLASARR